MQSRLYSLAAIIAALVIVDQKTARNLAATTWISMFFFDDSIAYGGVATISRLLKILGLFCKRALMMMIAFITIKSSLVPLIEGLCAQI